MSKRSCRCTPPTWCSRTTPARSGPRERPSGELLESTFTDQPDLRFRGRGRYVGDDFVVSEWTATATDAEGRAIEWDGIDVFPFRDGLIARKDVYSGSHAPRLL
jgi:ketosteroid isomerase-like protein